MSSDDKVRVFISYSHNDRQWLDRLKVHIAPVVSNYSLEVWDDTAIDAGEKWHSKITENLNRSHIAVLLISADFLASDFIKRSELPAILEGAKSRGVTILPIIIGPCLFKTHEHLSQFKAVNDPAKPLTLLSPGEQDEIFLSAAEQLQRVAVNHAILKSKQRLDEQGGTIVSNLTEQERANMEQQNMINLILTFSMSFHIYNMLRAFCRNEYPKFLYRPKEHKDLIQHLRDHGYIEMIHMRSLKDGEDLLKKVKPTPVGRYLVELREKLSKDSVQ